MNVQHLLQDIFSSQRKNCQAIYMYDVKKNQGTSKTFISTNTIQWKELNQIYKTPFVCYKENLHTENVKYTHCHRYLYLRGLTPTCLPCSWNSALPVGNFVLALLEERIHPWLLLVWQSWFSLQTEGQVHPGEKGRVCDIRLQCH